MNTIRRVGAAAAGAALLISQLAFAVPVHAAVSGWQKGVNIVPTTTTDFGSDSFKQSLRNFKATGGNYVAFVIPYYQSNTGSTDVQAGWNTPTDAALVSAIDFAHSIGLAVTLKVHIDPYSNEWRAYINPGDRDTWFTNYGNVLVHLGQVGQAHSVEMIVLGTEMVSMAEDNLNATNTQHWLDMIAKVRKVYTGKLTYDANSDSNNEDPFVNEKSHIKFWSALDYAGLSVYYNLNSDNSVNGLTGAWDYWNNSDLRSFQQSVGKPLLFLEIGYRSLDNSHLDPWNWERSGNYNAQEQANDYEALMSYWNNYSYLQGVYWWKWETDPNAGGNGQTTYTPQNKPAQDVLTKWYSNPVVPGTPGTPAALSATGDANPGSPMVNQASTITAHITNSGGAVQNGIVDIEVYDQNNKNVFQQFFDGQSINADETRNFAAQWSPSSVGTYRVAVGVFTSGWAQNLMWNNNVMQITVGGGSNPATTTPPTTPPPAGTVSTNIWWPSDGSTVTGVQPFKAMLENMDVSQYQMFWQVDGDQLNAMADSSTDWPHKEALVDLSGWHWDGSGPYKINFVSKDKSGVVISQKSVNINIAQ